MNIQERQITYVKLSASHDPGHGGSSYYYEIDTGGETYKVTLTISGSFPRHLPLPRPGESFPPLPYMKEALVKDNRQVEEFLRNLSVEFGVFELTDLETRHWLHPTSYTFNFRDSSSAEHGFKYMIDCSNYLDERYKRLVEAFDDFFELERISTEGARVVKHIQRGAKRLEWNVETASMRVPEFLLRNSANFCATLPWISMPLLSRS